MMNRQIVVAARPFGMPKESDFRLVEAPLPQPSDGQALVQTVYLSVDPYMRSRMTGVKTYADPVNIGDVMVGGTVSKVVESRDPSLKPGDFVLGYLGWQEYAVARARDLTKIDPGAAPLSTALGVLGMPGMTAYFGLLEIGQPKPGETVVVSGAAGAVGSLVGQIAKIKGCRAVGIAGTDQKVGWLTGELGFDAAFNYKTTSDYIAKLRDLCPNGIDVYFDNVGGTITDAVFRLINTRARIAICGQISQYNSTDPMSDTGPRFLTQVLVKTARIEGFLVFQFADRQAESIRQMGQWLREGRIKYREEFTEGLESAPIAFIGMLRGQNTGKQLVRVATA
jgi:NADPH-dependent curcumin reductase CurA